MNTAELSDLIYEWAGNQYFDWFLTSVEHEIDEEFSGVHVLGRVEIYESFAGSRSQDRHEPAEIGYTFYIKSAGEYDAKELETILNSK